MRSGASTYVWLAGWLAAECDVMMMKVISKYECGV